MSDDTGSAGRGFVKLLGLLAVALLFLAAMFWPYVAIWVSEFFGV